MTKNLFLVLVFLECLEEYSKKIFDFFTFSPQNRALKYPRRPRCTGSGVAKIWVQNRPWRHVRDRRLFISVFHCFSIQNQSFFGVNNPKNDRVCMKIQWNIEINRREKNVTESNFFLNTLLCIVEIQKLKKKRLYRHFKKCARAWNLVFVHVLVVGSKGFY